MDQCKRWRLVLRAMTCGNMYTKPNWDLSSRITKKIDAFKNWDRTLLGHLPKKAPKKRQRYELKVTPHTKRYRKIPVTDSPLWPYSRHSFLFGLTYQARGSPKIARDGAHGILRIRYDALIRAESRELPHFRTLMRGKEDEFMNGTRNAIKGFRSRKKFSFSGEKWPKKLGRGRKHQPTFPTH